MKRRDFLKGVAAAPVIVLLPGSAEAEHRTANWFDHHDTDIHAKPVRSVEADGRQPIYVLAGTWKQARNWMLANGLHGKLDASYIGDHRKLQGTAHGMKFVRVGTWHQRPDLNQIDLMLESREAIEISPITGDFAWHVQGENSWRGRVPWV